MKSLILLNKILICVCIFVIESKFEPFLIEEVDAMLLAHEARLQKFH